MASIKNKYQSGNELLINKINVKRSILESILQIWSMNYSGLCLVECLQKYFDYLKYRVYISNVFWTVMNYTF